MYGKDVEHRSYSLPSEYNSSGMRMSHSSGGIFSRTTITFVVLALCLLGVAYKYNESQGLVKDKDSQITKIQQQQDSISAQLQVIYEHKSRLEKTLEEQKESHMTALRKAEDDASEAKEEVSRIKDEEESKYDALYDEYSQLREQLEQANTELSQTKGQLNSAKDAQLNLQTKDQATIQSLRTEISECDGLKSQYIQQIETSRSQQNTLELDKQSLQTQVAQLQDTLKTCRTANVHNPVEIPVKPIANVNAPIQNNVALNGNVPVRANAQENLIKSHDESANLLSTKAVTLAVGGFANGKFNLINDHLAKKKDTNEIAGKPLDVGVAPPHVETVDEVKDKPNAANDDNAHENQVQVPLPMDNEHIPHRGQIDEKPVNNEDDAKEDDEPEPGAVFDRPYDKNGERQFDRPGMRQLHDPVGEQVNPPQLQDDNEDENNDAVEGDDNLVNDDDQPDDEDAKLDAELLDEENKKEPKEEENF